MVGALADWFAVTALFRHPLGLPIPHTAIIPRKKDQIGASLGTFVQENFLTTHVVEEKLATVDVPGRLGAFLAAPGRAERLAGDAGVALTALTDLLRDDDVQPAVAALVDRKLHETPLAPVVARALELDRRGRPAPGGAVGGAARPGPLPRGQQGRLPRAAGRRLPRLGAGLGGREGVRPGLHRRPGVPRRGRGRPAARAAPVLRRPSARLRARAAHRPGDRRPRRGAQAGAARAPGRARVVGLAVEQRQERRRDRGRRPGVRAARPPGDP